MTHPLPLSLLRRGLPHWPPLLLGLCVLLLGSDSAAHLLRYQRTAVMDGEWWRLLSGHLVHLGPVHLGLNLAGLALVWALFGPRLSHAAWGLVLLLSALGCGLGLYWFSPGLIWYVGLSGVLHGLFVAGALAEWRVDPRSSAVLLAVLAAKLLWEQLAGGTPGTARMIGGAVVVDAHLYGAISGLLAFAVLSLFRASTAKKTR